MDSEVTSDRPTIPQPKLGCTGSLMALAQGVARRARCYGGIRCPRPCVGTDMVRCHPLKMCWKIVKRFRDVWASQRELCLYCWLASPCESGVHLQVLISLVTAVITCPEGFNSSRSQSAVTGFFMSASDYTSSDNPDSRIQICCSAPILVEICANIHNSKLPTIF